MEKEEDKERKRIEAFKRQQEMEQLEAHMEVECDRCGMMCKGL